MPSTGWTPVLPESAAPGIRSGKLAGRSLGGAMTIIALPVMLEQFAAAFVALVDKIFAGHLPAEIVRPALDGLGLASYVTWLVSIAVGMIGIGSMALIARAIGGGDGELAERALGQSVLFGAIWGGIVGAVLWFAAPWLAVVANLTPEATAYCVGYIRILSGAMPLTGFLFVSMHCLRGAGETTRPFLIMVVVNIVNIVASWFFSGVEVTFGETVIANPSPFRMHVLGIAVGTVCGHVVGAGLMYGLLLRGVHGLRLHHRNLRPDLSVLRRIVRVGVPGFLDGLGLWVGQLIAVIWVLGVIARRTGQEQGLIGSHEIAIQWESFSFLPGHALAIAAGALAGQYLGAGNPQMARRAILACTGAAMAIMGFAGLVFIFFGEQLTRIISRDPVHLELAPLALFIVGFVQVFFAIGMVIRGGLAGAGDTRTTMLITWLSTWGIRLPLTWLLGYVLGYGFLGVWVGLSIELALRGCLFAARFLHGGWTRVEV